MRARINAVLYFVLTVAAVLVTLRVLNWLPLVLQKETLRTYDSIEDVGAKLIMKELLVPSYFPESIAWPPERILAQSAPYPAVMMVFDRAGEQDALIISQAASDAFPGRLSMPSLQIVEKVPYDLQGRKALLEVGSCETQEPCSRISWTEGGSLHIVLSMKSPPFELIRIAESMLP